MINQSLTALKAEFTALTTVAATSDNAKAVFINLKRTNCFPNGIVLNFSQKEAWYYLNKQIKADGCNLIDVWKSTVSI